jgi:hypothetical protein
MPPIETSGVKNDEDLDALVERVQNTIMRELGIKQLSARRPKVTAPQNRK